jgi:hypothetical protein
MASDDIPVRLQAGGLRGGTLEGWKGLGVF